MPSPPIALVVHGHFYQPPRENPWTDAVPREASASPFHDWNDRINAECYRANAYARMFGAGDRITGMANNYGHMSFNFGATLARWIERNDPRTDARIREGDREQHGRLGAGGALAQVWAHPITPLLSPHDRRTQILWGLADYRRRFGQHALGMWLPETALDPATLEALIDAGVAFTVVAPEQIASVRAPGEGWTPVNRDTLDTGRAYRWLSSDGSGRSIALAVFDGPLSRDIAFGTAARDAATYLARVKAAAERSSVQGQRLVLAASDGELYGHHKRFADLTLAYLTQIEAENGNVEVTNIAAYLAAHPPTWEADLSKGPHGEGTAWSCTHGFGRWRRHCGCAINPAAHPSQAWRGPLRDALDQLRDAGAGFFEDAGADLFEDPWGARDAYGEVIDAPPSARLRWLREFGRHRLRRGDGSALRRAHLLMEMQRAAQLMYASCGWFFDDIAGIEAAIVIRQGAYVLDLWRELGGHPPARQFMERLSLARSNTARLGNGADVFRRVSRNRMTPVKAVAEVAFRALAPAPEYLASPSVPGFRIGLSSGDPAFIVGDGPRETQGTATVLHERTGEIFKVAYRARYDGRVGFELASEGKRILLSDLNEDAALPILRALLQRVAAKAPTPSSCRAVLDVFGKFAAGATPGSALDTCQDLLGYLLVGLLANLPTEDVSAETLAVLDELIDRAALPAKNETSRRVEELLWDKLSGSASGSKPVPPALKAVAQRFGFVGA